MQEQRKQVSEGFAVSPWWPAVVLGSPYPGFTAAAVETLPGLPPHQLQGSRCLPAAPRLLGALSGLF